MWAVNPGNVRRPVFKNMGVSQNLGYHFGGPYNKDYSFLGSILGYPYFGKLPYLVPREWISKETRYHVRRTCNHKHLPAGQEALGNIANPRSPSIF